MKKYLLLFCLIFISVIFTAYSQQNKPMNQDKPILEQNNDNDKDIANMDPIYTLIGIPTEINQKCLSFFNLLINNEIEKAYNELLKNSPLERNKDKVKEQIIKTTQAIELYGKITSSEQAGAEYTSISYVKVKYLSLHPFNPILWTFTFYNSPTIGWIVLNLKYTDTF
ncbi:hypothetical protein D9V86_05565 [Bacteroidetes/Chlorobi group bacterium ChocPot_Mid]|jgi:cbb3-type cytochrome oxidase subunit 3|nr:MAG: hypothetical protein D9V86_05565 [Bacteroidetes/Chlorobi group bacterium ChocPot_Mid]